jgi:hypothetical protein
VEIAALAFSLLKYNEIYILFGAGLWLCYIRPLKAAERSALCRSQ